MITYTVKVDKDKTEWYLNGQLHREDGPAIEYSNGSKYWYLNGQRHRTDGPAVEYKDDYKAWYLNDKLHRTDGPAVEYGNGSKSWYLNGQQLTEQEFLNRNKVTELTLEQIADKFGISVDQLKIKK